MLIVRASLSVRHTSLHMVRGSFGSTLPPSAISAHRTEVSQSRRSRLDIIRCDAPTAHTIASSSEYECGRRAGHPGVPVILTGQTLRGPAPEPHFKQRNLSALSVGVA